MVSTQKSRMSLKRSRPFLNMPQLKNQVRFELKNLAFGKLGYLYLHFLDDMLDRDFRLIMIDKLSLKSGYI